MSVNRGYTLVLILIILEEGSSAQYEDSVEKVAIIVLILIILEEGSSDQDGRSVGSTPTPS